MLNLCMIHNGKDRKKEGVSCFECTENRCAVKILNDIAKENPRMYIAFIDLLAGVKRGNEAIKSLSGVKPTCGAESASMGGGFKN